MAVLRASTNHPLSDSFQLALALPGINVNGVFENGFIPLTAVVRESEQRLSILLRAHGININRADREGRTLLMEILNGRLRPRHSSWSMNAWIGPSATLTHWTLR
jgi:hypothetical protein